MTTRDVVKERARKEGRAWFVAAIVGGLYLLAGYLT
ncbi:hypothetical protein BXY70_1313 [Roseovarius halotolerans]|uniref:Uncharacterized protein n=1 Tax=Roseovarius halotolerans TaxID=505353 RepID=A0A1X6Y5F7_9RHOB|nr:hypothetical protein BXY70_1313 [Roseovarius halotolerans]SLN11307.1 hypothetical protein ROH8110_00083 [Roseovarius halotolerans]